MGPERPKGARPLRSGRWRLAGEREAWPWGHQLIPLLGPSAVQRDRVKMWANVAAAAPSDKQAEYARLRDAIASKLTPAQLAEAEKTAREWSESFDRRKK